MKADKIIWAMNPFSDDKQYFRHALKVVGEFAAAHDAQVEPVYMLAPPNLFFPAGASPSLLEPLEPKLETTWKQLNKGNKHASRFSKPVLLTVDSLSVRQTTRALSEYAWTKGARMIAVATHGRKGVARLFMGSFAESLLQESSVPTFVFNPKSEKAGRTKKIFFPVELPLRDKAPVDEVLQFAKQNGAKIVFFHKVDYINEFTVSPLYQVPVYQDYLEHDIDTRFKELESLLARAVAAGVPAEIVLDKAGTNVPDRILAAARKYRADLIAMVATTGRVQSALLGSVTRQIIRSAAVPVWVLHPSKQANVTVAPHRFETGPTRKFVKRV